MNLILRLSMSLLISACMMLGGCSASTAAKTDAADDVAAIMPAELHCATAADCSVKNVGNCCGYYPACVHKDQAVDPDAVQTKCAAEGLNSICGFPEISACACVEGKCTPAAAGAD